MTVWRTRAELCADKKIPVFDYVLRICFCTDRQLVSHGGTYGLHVETWL